MVRRELHIIGRNRAYYAIFHAINAIHALDGNGYKRHKDTIVNFNKRYVENENILEENYEHFNHRR